MAAARPARRAAHAPCLAARPRAGDWLAQLGVDAAFYEGRLVDHWSCFSGRAPGELMVQGRKLVGISQTWRRKRALLWSGTLVRAVPWPLLCDAMARPADQSGELAATTISMEELGRRPADIIHAAGQLRSALARAAAGQEGVADAPVA